MMDGLSMNLIKKKNILSHLSALSIDIKHFYSKKKKHLYRLILFQVDFGERCVDKCEEKNQINYC